MKKNNGFDEMQKAKRDKIGNQTFYIMFYLLMLDVGLHGFGIKWLSYPMNVWVIILISMITYLVRVILGNAYVPPETGQPKSKTKNIVWVVLAVIVSAVLAFSLSHSHFGEASANNDHSAIILAIVSVVGLLIVGIISLVKKLSNKDNDDE